MAKYHNRKTYADGRCFDSKREASYYLVLKAKMQNGEISDLEMQKEYVLIPYQKGKLRNERKCSYKADFVYKDSTGSTVVVDVKGLKTREYIIKRKLMKMLFGIEILEV